MSLTTGIKAYWKFDEASGNPVDASGNGVTLTNNGSTPFGTGIINNGANFGTTNTAKYFINTATSTYNGGAGTVSVWVNMQTAPTSGNTQTFFGALDSVTSSFLYMEYRNVAGTLKLAFGRSRFNIANDEVLITQTLALGTWYNLIVSYDGTTVTAYLNNASQGAIGSAGNGTGAPASQTYVGSYEGTANFATATIDEMGIWNRSLSVGEVNTLYNGTVGIQYAFGVGNFLSFMS